MYNVSYDVVGIILAVSLIFIHYFLFDRTKYSNRIFTWFLLCVLVECSLDFITALQINGIISVHDNVAMILNSVYFFSTMLSAYVGCRMTAVRMEFKNDFVKTILLMLFVIAVFFIAVNLFLHQMFYFKDGQYIKSSMFSFLNYVSIAFLLSIPLMIWAQRKILNSTEKMAPFIFVACILVTFVYQVIFGDVLLIGFGKALATLVYGLLMEMPEHVRVKGAVEELAIAQENERMLGKKLLAANNAKTEFLVKMTHQLRTPINAILGFSEVFIKENSDKELLVHVDEINKNGEHLLDLVDDIVNFSQLETGKLELNEREYELSEAFLLFKDILERHGSRYRQTITRNITSDMPKRLYGDVKKVAQVCERLCNFIDNGDDENYIFMDVILNRIVKNKMFADIVIQDKKSNISLEMLDADMNIGIVKKLLEALGTTLIYEPKKPSGSVLKFTIEQEIVDLKAIGDLSKAVEEYENNKFKNHDDFKFILPEANILVVDDTSLNLKVISGLLKPYKANVVCVESGEKALEYMKTNKVDFVFMDILMPDMDGTQTLKHIRKDEGIISKDAIAVALTANIFSGARDYYLSCGFADYITKPVNGHRLGEAFKEFLPHLIKQDWHSVEVNIEV